MTTPLRVLAVGNVYPPHHLGGYELIWRGVMRQLRRGGHQVRVLTTDYRSAAVSPDAGEDPDVHRQLDWYWREHQWRSLGLLARLRLERHNAAVFDRHLDEFRPDVITWWPVGGMSLGLIERARGAGVPAVLFVLDYWLSYGPERDLWMRMWGRWRLGPAALRLTGLPARVDYAAAGRWVFCSRTVREHSLHLAPRISPADSTVLSPGVDDAFLSTPRDSPPERWRWRLLYLGRVVEPKGVHTAIESLALLPPEAGLRIVGEGDRPYRVSLERLAARLGVSGRVSFEPPRPREQLIDLYRSADAVVFPVQWPEPWGLVPLEAMAVGRPVLATGHGGSGDYLSDGENTLLFSAGDPAGLARAVRSLAVDPSLRERLRRGGYATAAAHSERDFNRGAVDEIVAAAGGRRPGA